MHIREVVVVDRDDHVIGSMELREAKRRGEIVRIVRVLLFNSKRELYLQRRGPNVDFPGVLDQSAGGHVDKGESYEQAARRETAEEIGIADLKLEPIANYYTDDEYFGGFQLKRFNRLYVGHSDEPVRIDAEEVAGGEWVSQDRLGQMIADDPSQFAAAFVKAYRIYRDKTG